MKKNFIPSMDELYQMQEMGANVYKYLLVKTIESLICYGINYPNAGILKSAYKYLSEDPEIARAICTLYPEEILYSEFARKDFELCMRLINSGESKTCGLDYLTKFDESILSNSTVLESTVLLLNKELSNNPRYRFEYVGCELQFARRGAGCLLNNIFERKITNKELIHMPEESRFTVIKKLINIEPAYALSLFEEVYEDCLGLKETVRKSYLNTGIYNYANRYKITPSVGTQYVGKDILTNPTSNVKRLLKTIYEKNK